MYESQIELIKPKGFTINIPSVMGAPVAIRTESDEVVILMCQTLRPRDNVKNERSEGFRQTLLRKGTTET